MKARFNENLNIEIEIESIDDLKILGLENCKNLKEINFILEESEDADRHPVEITKSKHPNGIFITVNEKIESN